MLREYSTGTVPPRQRTRYWQAVTSSAILPVKTSFERPAQFAGRLRVWELGEISLMQLQSGAVRYEHLPDHAMENRHDSVLVTFSEQSDIHFRQDGVELRCRARQFFLERPGLASDFRQLDDNEIWTIKLPLGVLKRHTRSIDVHYGAVFDGDAGVGGLLMDMVRQIPLRCGHGAAVPLHGVGNALVELLLLATESDVRALGSSESSIQRGHLARIERYARRHLGDPELSVESIAAACRMSVRYLQLLFRGTRTTPARWIREMRLEACRAQICEPQRGESLGEIAFRWGYLDQATFSRQFRAHFGVTPRDMRAAAVRDAARLRGPREH